MLEDRINELNGTARMFFEWSTNYRNQYYDLKPDDVWEEQSFISNDLSKYLVLNSNLYFLYNIIIIGTLLAMKQIKVYKKELSLFEHLEFLDEDIKTEAKNDLAKLRKIYTSSGLEILRHKIFAHKDIQTSGDPLSLFLNMINDKFIQRTKDLLEKIDKYINTYFKDRICNNYSKEYFDKSHTIILDTIKKKLLNVE